MRTSYILLLLISVFLLVPMHPVHAQQVPPSESDDEMPADAGSVPAPDLTPLTPPADTKPPAPPTAVTPLPGQAVPPAVTTEPPPAAAEELPYSSALLQGINKVTARAETIEAKLGEVQRFGNLEIIARTCWQSAPEERPENAVLLEVWELKPGEGRSQIFNGWMFSSSPSLSSLVHPVYDLTVLECQRRKEKEE